MPNDLASWTSEFKLDSRSKQFALLPPMAVIRSFGEACSLEARFLNKEGH
ncbi:hypothetical protein Sjap_003715 [Stephania japonica]|uniref:Uncharacterized protein n=1 Tax=Stephania japonica TaxID=461633 RepID=A0AAP0PVB2_9MAGN